MFRIRSLSNLVAIGVVVGCGLSAPSGSVAWEVPRVERETAYEELELFAESLLAIRKHYVDEKEYKALIYGALSGMLKSLDPHCSFLEPEEFQDMQEETSGRYSGIGIHIGIRDDWLTVIAPIEDTPAYQAGLISGDRIVAIDGEKTAGIPLKDAIQKLRGMPGTQVKVSIRRLDVDQPLEFEITRKDIEVSSVKGATLLRDQIGYVRITQFSEPTAQALQHTLQGMVTNGLQGLVLDLRGNPGGLLVSAINVAEQFLPRNEVVVSTRGRGHLQGNVVNRSGGTFHLTGIPMAILINGGSASASEIVAGALQDHRRAVLVGETTFGKGSVQTVLRLSADREAALRLTTALYYTPGGRQIHNKGIEPDIPVYVAPTEWRRILTRRLHIENPSLYTDKDRAGYEDVVDRPLERALDLVQALVLYQSADARR